MQSQEPVTSGNGHPGHGDRNIAVKRGPEVGSQPVDLPLGHRIKLRFVLVVGPPYRSAVVDRELSSSLILFPVPVADASRTPLRRIASKCNDFGLVLRAVLTFACCKPDDSAQANAQQNQQQCSSGTHQLSPPVMLSSGLPFLPLNSENPLPSRISGQRRLIIQMRQKNRRV